jgi:hypothetical protein
MKPKLCVVGLIVMVGMTAASAAAQQAPPAQAGTEETTCTFQDGQQITIQYPDVKYSPKTEPQEDRPWMPGGKPVYLFSQATLSLSGATVPPGAYSVYMVPGKKDWAIIINKDVTKGAAYDQTQDLGKVQAEVGKLPDPAKRLKLYFGHVAPKTCTLRIDFGKQRANGHFTEQ